MESKCFDTTLVIPRKHVAITGFCLFFIAFLICGAPPQILAQEPTHPDAPYYQYVSSACMFGFGGCSIAVPGGSQGCGSNTSQAIVFNSPAGANPNVDGNNYPASTTGCLVGGLPAQYEGYSATVGPPQTPVEWMMIGSGEQAVDPISLTLDSAISLVGPNNGALVNSFVAYYQQNLEAPVLPTESFRLVFAMDGFNTNPKGIQGTSGVSVCVWTDAPDYECVHSLAPKPGSHDLEQTFHTPSVLVGPSGRYTILVFGVAVVTGGAGQEVHISLTNVSAYREADAKAYEEDYNREFDRFFLKKSDYVAVPVPGAQTITARGILAAPPLSFPGKIGHGVPTLFDATHPVVGFYVNSSGATEGFENFGNGDVTSIVAPNDNVGFTRALAINNSGTIVGDYEQNYGPGINRYRGFLLKNGTYTTYDEGDTVSTDIYNINDNGDFVGSFSNFSVPFTGFVQKADGTLTTFSVPGATGTLPAAINNAGLIVGYYTDSSNNSHGFLRALDGRLFPFDFPRAVQTFPFSITDRDTINGYFVDSAGASHGFFGAFPNFTQYDLRGQGASGVVPSILNSDGSIAGAYSGPAGVIDGFAAQLCATNISSDLAITRGSFRMDPVSGEVLQEITLRNNGATAIEGPMYLLFESVTPGVFLDNGNLISRCQSPGDPYVIVNFNLPPGKQITTTVGFVVGTANPISYGLVVLAGGQLP